MATFRRKGLEGIDFKGLDTKLPCVAIYLT